MKRPVAWLLSALLIPSVSLAVGTQSFVVDSSEAFEKGKLEGASVQSDGKVLHGVATKRTVIDGAAVAYTSSTGPDGGIYVSTGNQGVIFRVQGGAHSVFARTDAAVVSALSWANGVLYAGTLEQGKVLAIDAKGTSKVFATLPPGTHVWALAYEPKTATLYAATGPEGKLFAIDKAGKAVVLHDDLAEHLLCLALDAKGTLYSGTSNGARLLRTEGKKTSVLYDAPGQELGALSVGPGFIAIASNDFEINPVEVTKDPTGRGKRVKPGKGKVFAVSLDGGIEELYRNDSAHVTALEVAGEAVHVGLAQEGRIVRVARGQISAVWADADERSVTAIHLTDKTPHFVSSDGVAVYTLDAPNAMGTWTSHALDAKVPARFGELHVRGKGALSVATRSGNTETPDDSWSAWSANAPGTAPIRSAAARFLQVRAQLSGDAELYAIEAYYLPQNLPAYVRNVRGTRALDKPAERHVLALAWDVDNADGDRLRYRLGYRREDETRFLSMLPEQELLEKNEYRWDTSRVPDGRYRVRVQASDELASPSELAEAREALSAPILIDNHGPQISKLQVKDGRLRGEVRDQLGPVAQLELSIDGAVYRPLPSRDGLLDTALESFDVPLEKLSPGAHVLSVQASDAAKNVSSAAIEYEEQRR